MNGQNDVEVRVGAQVGDLDTGFDHAKSTVRRGTEDMEESVRRASVGMEASLGMVKGIIQQLGLAVGSGFIAREVFKIASSFEQLEIRLKGVMGSSQGGEEALAWIKQFAVDTPYSVENTTEAFLRLKNFGLDPMDGTLRKLADASAKYGDGAQAITSVTLAMGQAWARGKLQGQDILQLINAGIPVWGILEQVTEKNTAQLQKMSEQGELTRAVMRDFIDELGRSGAGMAEAQMNSLSGSISNLQDSFANAIDEVRGEGGFDFLTDSVKGATEAVPEAVQTFAVMGKTLGDIFSLLKSIVVTVMRSVAQAIDSVFGTQSESMTGMQLFINMLKVVQTAVIGFGVIVKEAFEAVRITLAWTVNWFLTFANVAERALHLDFSGAKAAWKKGMEDNAAILLAGQNELVRIAVEGKSKIDAVLLGTGKKTSKTVSDHAVAPLGDISSGDDGKAAQKLREKAAKQNAAFDRAMYEENLRIEKEFLNKKGELYQRDIALKKQSIEAKKQAVLDQIDAEEAAARDEVEIGSLTKAQLIALEEDFENRRYEVKRSALEERKALIDPDLDPVTYQQLVDEIEAIERRHQANVSGIRREAIKEQLSLWESLGSSLESLWDQGMQALLNGTLTFGNAFRAIGATLVGWFAREVVGEMLKKWLAAEAAKIAHKIGFNALERALNKAASIETIATKTTEAGAVSAANAVEAGSGAAASQASIPIVGPALALAAMAAVFAAVSGLGGKVKSASMGFDIPKGLNPMTQLHSEEMVLPDKYANVIRGMAEGGSSGGGAISIHASSDKDLLRVSDLKKILRSMGREFIDVRG